MNKITRKQWIAGIAIAVMILLTLIVAPNRSQISEGSTYSRSPSGYAGWYAYMEQTSKNLKIQRWQKPFQTLTEKLTTPITLIRINPELEIVTDQEQKWLDSGNHLIVLGVAAKTTAAPFTSVITSLNGNIKIETTRRQEDSILSPNQKLTLSKSAAAADISTLDQSDEYINLLEDEFGGIVWQEKGTLIFSVTPYLAANAYQNEEGNYKFLADLVTALKAPIYVDEYIHGYKDTDPEKTESTQTWLSYLMATPLFAGIVQALIVLIVLIIAKNRRFGAAIAPQSSTLNNSQAYIEAMSAVLQKAERSEFVWQAIAKAEQKKLQQKLGMGQVDQKTLITAWVQQTNRPQSELEYLLNPLTNLSSSSQTPNRKISEPELLRWIIAWQKVLKSL